jgi:hypothetical protein
VKDGAHQGKNRKEKKVENDKIRIQASKQIRREYLLNCPYIGGKWGR